MSKMKFSWYPKYAVDIVLCIDGKLPGESQEKDSNNLLDSVKTMARRMARDIHREMEAKGKRIDSFRVQTIVFREYLKDGERAMLTTDFYALPEETMPFEIALNRIDSEGEFSQNSDGLEALAYAIKSKWNTEYAHRRQVIIVWSDKGANVLGSGRKSSYYPKGMVQSMEELQEWWDALGGTRRLVLFTPNSGMWNHISMNWDYVIHYPSGAGDGIPYSVYDEAVRCIVKDV